MSLSRRLTRSAEDVLVEELRRIKDRLRRLENQHSPTMPIYNPDFPDDAVDGQFALASTPPVDIADDSDAKPYFRWDEFWHPFDQGTDHWKRYFILSTNNFDIPTDSDEYIEFDDTATGTPPHGSWVTNDTADGSTVDGEGDDPYVGSILGYDPDFPARISGTKPGIYLISGAIDFQLTVTSPYDFYAMTGIDGDAFGSQPPHRTKHEVDTQPDTTLRLDVEKFGWSRDFDSLPSYQLFFRHSYGSDLRVSADLMVVWIGPVISGFEV